MYSKPITIIVVMCFAAIIGCVTDAAERTYSVRPSRAVDSVEILWRRPNANFEVIADYQARNMSPEQMRVWAASRGADAVIVALLGATNYTSNETEVRSTNPDQIRQYTRITGTAIVYK